MPDLTWGGRQLSRVVAYAWIVASRRRGGFGEISLDLHCGYQASNHNVTNRGSDISGRSIGGFFL